MTVGRRVSSLTMMRRGRVAPVRPVATRGASGRYRRVLSVLSPVPAGDCDTSRRRRVVA